VACCFLANQPKIIINNHIVIKMSEPWVIRGSPLFIIAISLSIEVASNQYLMALTLYSNAQINGGLIGLKFK